MINNYTQKRGSKLSIFILLFLASTSIFGQEVRLKYADDLYSRLAYYPAIEAYKDVLERNSDSSSIAKKIAVSYDKLGNTQKALEWYHYLERQGPLEKNQQLRLALLEREIGNYKVSEKLMSDFISRYGEMDVARSIVNSSSNMEQLKVGTGIFELKKQNVNTVFSEIGTSYYSKNQVIMASSKRHASGNNFIDNWTGNLFYDLYTASIEEDGTIGEMSKIKSQVQSKYHDGPAVFDQSTGYFYFTRNNYLEGKRGIDNTGVMRMKIYRAKLVDSRFINITELAINDDAYSTAHPAISKDGKVLFFASDRPGGFGGMDIYSVKLDENGVVGQPVNLGSKLNTTQDDVFPSFNQKENILFFSSKGHAGLGGLDVFVAKLNKYGDVSKVENLGAPVNSLADDFSFVNNESQTQGYFSSNRDGGKGSDDVYGFNQLKVLKNSPILKGSTKDLVAGDNLENMMIYLADKNGTILDSVKTDSNGDFELNLNKVTGNFLIIGKKEGYVSGNKNIIYQADKMEYIEDFKVMPVLDYYFTGVLVDKDTKEPLEGVKVSIIDQKNKGKVDVQLTDYEGKFTSNNLPYKYYDNVDYKIKIEKDGFINKTIEFREMLDVKAGIGIDLKGDSTTVGMDRINVGKTDLGAVVDIQPIYFDLNSSVIRKDASLELDKIVTVMLENPRMVIELGSHTDSRASDSYNLSLSDRRAKSSANYIISRGIGKDRIAGKGYGEKKLIVQDAEIEKAATEEEKEVLHQKNRRTEFIIVKMK